MFRTQLILLPLLTIILIRHIVSGCNQTCQAGMELSYLEAIQRKLLHSLRLRGPLLNISIPNISQDELEELMDDGDHIVPENLVGSNTVIVFSTACNNHIPNCMGFHFAHSSLSSVISARLVFTLNFSQINSDEETMTPAVPVNLKIFRVFKDGVIDSEALARDNIEMRGAKKLIVSLDPEELRSWHKSDVIGLLITAEASSDYDSDEKFSFSIGAKPSIILETEPSIKRNRRHGENYCPPESTEKGCCLRDLVIDFTQLGWNFIMAPKRYNAFMCRGDCTISHSHVLRFGHSKMIKDAQLDIGHHCCHPTEYESLKIIYTRADNEIIITRVPGMIARKCACT